MEKNEVILANIMVLAACCDGDFTTAEIRRIGAILSCYPHFPNLEADNLREIATNCLESKVNGIKEIVNTLPKDYHLPALAFAYEVCAADLKIVAEEKIFLKDIKEALNISDELTNALEISIQSRYFPSDPADTMPRFPITGENSLH